MTDPDAVNPETGRRPKAGRPALLTPELTAEVARLVGVGNYLKVAAQYAGISAATLHAWLARGRAATAQIELHADGDRRCPSCDLNREEEAHTLDALNSGDDPAGAVLGPCPRCDTAELPRPWTLPDGETKYLTFLEAVTQAESRAEVAAVTHWRAAFANDWRAARDYLVRSKPDRWAATTRIAISSDEAEARIEQATTAALTALGIDTEPNDPRADEPGAFDFLDNFADDEEEDHPDDPDSV